MSFEQGLKSGDYSKNPYCPSSNEFDAYERGCTQALKRGILNTNRLRSDFEYYGLNRGDGIDYCELKGSKVINHPQSEIPRSNSYASAKG